MDWFEIRLALKSLFLPPIGLLLVVVAGLVIARRHRAGKYVVVGALGMLVTLAMPATAILLTTLLDPPSTVDVAAARRAQALVIVGGGGKLRSPVTDDGLGRLSVERMRYGARLARLTRLPVLVTGGTVGRAGPEATAMAHALEREFGTTPRWVEPEARDTRENAERSRTVLQNAGVQRIVLVVHAFDMRRTRHEFERAGFDVLPAPVGAIGTETLRWLDFIPGVAGLESSYFALYELLAGLLPDRRDRTGG